MTEVTDYTISILNFNTAFALYVSILEKITYSYEYDLSNIDCMTYLCLIKYLKNFRKCLIGIIEDKNWYNKTPEEININLSKTGEFIKLYRYKYRIISNFNKERALEIYNEITAAPKINRCTDYLSWFNLYCTKIDNKNRGSING